MNRAQGQQIEAASPLPLCITLACTDARVWWLAWTWTACGQRRAKPRTAIEAAEKPTPDKNPYLTKQNFFMFTNPPEDWPKIGEVSMDEVCPGCVTALQQSNGQKCKEGMKFVGDDALYCFGFCEGLAVN